MGDDDLNDDLQVLWRRNAQQQQRIIQLAPGAHYHEYNSNMDDDHSINIGGSVHGPVGNKQQTHTAGRDFIAGTPAALENGATPSAPVPWWKGWTFISLLTGIAAGVMALVFLNWESFQGRLFLQNT